MSGVENTGFAFGICKFSSELDFLNTLHQMMRLNYIIYVMNQPEKFFTYFNNYKGFKCNNIISWMSEVK